VADLAAGFRIIADHSGQALTQLAGVVCQNWEPLSANDGAIAFRVHNGDDAFITYMQAFTRWDERSLWELLAQSSALSARERMPTLCILYALLPHGYQSQGGQFRLRIGAEPTQALWFREVCLWELRPEPWWEMFAGVMALFPLSRHQMPPAQALTMAAERIHKHEKEPRQRADLMTVLALLTRQRYPDLDVLGILGKERMHDSPLYQELLAEGGVAQCRDDIAQVVHVRFGDREARQLKKLLARIGDLEQLTELLREAASARRFDALRKTVEEAAS
jgi:hypothetical protein